MNELTYSKWLELQKTSDATVALKAYIDLTKQSLEPVEILSPDRWADQYRKVGDGGPIPGQWSYDYTPYMRKPCEDFIDEAIDTVVLMCSTQIGKSAVMSNIIGSVIAQAPAPMYFVTADANLATDFKQDALEDMFENSGFYKKELVKRTTPGSSDTNDRKIRFRGGFLAMASSNSLASLSGRSAKYMFFDEIDRFVASKKEGDPLTIGKNRTNAYADSRKIFIASTPTDAANSRIYKAFLLGDQCRYEIGCPHCGHRQFLEWVNVVWETTKSADGTIINHSETAYYRCTGSGCRIVHEDKPYFKDCVWVPQAKPVLPKTRSYHLNALYGPKLSFPQLVEMYVEAVAAPGGIRTFTNTYLAEVYEEPSDQPQYEKLHARAELYERGRVPRGVGFLTCGVDVQEKGDGRLEASVWGWGRNQQRWLIDHAVFEGSYKEADTWLQLDEYRHMKYTTDDGRELDISLTLVDSSAGNTTNYVYEYCRINRMDRVKALKGGKNPNGALNPVTKLETDSNGKKLRGSIQLIGPNVHQYKKWLYHSLNEVTDPKASQYIHLPQFVGIEWFRQLCAEKVMIEGTKEVFKKAYARNEALDCAVYAHSAAVLCNLDRKNWDVLFKKQGAEPEELNESTEQAEVLVKLIEIYVLKRFKYGVQWYEMGEILNVSEQDAARLCTLNDPFARRNSSKMVTNEELLQLAPPKNKPKPPKKKHFNSWLSK